MKVLQINAVYGGSSTGRTAKEMHEYMIAHGIESYIASPDICGSGGNFYKIGNKLDRKVHGLMSRITGLQGYFSRFPTLGLIRYIKKVKPDIVHLRNLHGNYINIRMLLKFLSKSKTAVVVTLHDCWFYTGRCCHYIEDGCYKWQKDCGGCPALKKYNKSWFFDRSQKMKRDKERLFKNLSRLAVIGVSSWVTEDAAISPILGGANIITTIFNWIDCGKFRPHDTEELRKELQTGNKFVLLGISQKWSKLKGIDIFFGLEDIIDDDCVIIMVGDPNGYKSTDKIKFVGEVNNIEKLADYYSMADVFVNPSMQETFGKTTAEALCSGTPVVAFDSTAAPELIGRDGKMGFLVDANDPQLFWEKIKNIKAAGKDKYTEECRRTSIERFDMETNIKSYIDVYNELICTKSEDN